MSDPAVSEKWLAEDKGPAILAVSWVSTALSTIFVVSRIYVSLFIKRKFHSDDWFIIIGQICGYLSLAFATIAVMSGNGRHMAALTTEQKSGAILWTTVGFVPGLLSFGLPKLAVVSLLTRLLNPKRYHRWFLWWLGLWCVASVIVTGVLLLARCQPARSLWDFSAEGTCFDVQYLISFGLYAGAFSAFVDVYLAIYPAVVLSQLQMPIKKKLALCCALGIGLVSGVVAIYKTTRVPSIGSADFSYDTSDLVVWTILEGSSIMIASSIPVLQPLLELIMRRNPFTSRNKSSGNSKPGRSDGYDSFTDSKGQRYELGQRRMPSKKRDDLGFTVADDNSQEEILSSMPQSPHDHLAAASTVTAENDPSVPRGAIMRTDVVNISYSNRS